MSAELPCPGTEALGRAFATHIDDNGLDVHKLRESTFIEAHGRDREDQGYLAERGLQLHDLFHVLTGYDTSPRRGRRRQLHGRPDHVAPPRVPNRPAEPEVLEAGSPEAGHRGHEARRSEFRDS